MYLSEARQYQKVMGGNRLANKCKVMIWMGWREEVQET